MTIYGANLDRAWTPHAPPTFITIHRTIAEISPRTGWSWCAWWAQVNCAKATRGSSAPARYTLAAARQNDASNVSACSDL